MSINNFIPTLWSGNFIAALQKAQVFSSPAIVNRNYEGEISGFGDRVKIQQIGAISVSNYTKNTTSITFKQLEDASVFLEINQCKYFAFEIDDVDKAQVKGDVMGLAMNDAAYRVKDVIDQYIAGLHGMAGITSGLGTTATPLTVTAKATASSNISIQELFGTIKQKLDEGNVPTDGRFIILPPVMVFKLSLSAQSIVGVSQQQAAVSNGFVGNVWGFNVYMSNNVVNTSGAKYKVLAGTNQAISYAEQINSVEALRREDSFRDAVKGLMLYGANVIRPDLLACATVSSAAEA